MAPRSAPDPPCGLRLLPARALSEANRRFVNEPTRARDPEPSGTARCHSEITLVAEIAVPWDPDGGAFGNLRPEVLRSDRSDAGASYPARVAHRSLPQPGKKHMDYAALLAGALDDALDSRLP